MGCIRRWHGTWTWWQTHFSNPFVTGRPILGVVQVLHFSQPLASANCYQLGRKKKRKSLTKCFTLLQLALSHQPIPHRVKNSCQAVIVFFFFFSPDHSLGWSWTDNLRDCLFRLASDQECHFTKKCWSFRNKVSLQCGMKLGCFKRCQETVSAFIASCPLLNSPSYSWRAEPWSTVQRTQVWMAPEWVPAHV